MRRAGAILSLVMLSVLSHAEASLQSSASVEAPGERISVALTGVKLSILVPRGTKHWMYGGIERVIAYFENASCEMHISTGTRLAVEHERHAATLNGWRRIDIMRFREARMSERYEYWVQAESPDSDPDKTVLVIANCASPAAQDAAEAMIRSIAFITAPAISPSKPTLPPPIPPPGD